MPGSERPNNSWTSRKNGKLERNELSKNRKPSNGNGQDKSRVNGSTITKTVSENSSSVMGFRIYNAEFLSRYNRLFGYKRNRVGKGSAKCSGGGGDENCSRSAASEDSSFFRRLYFYRGNDSSTFTTPSAERRRSKSARMHRKPSISKLLLYTYRSTSFFHCLFSCYSIIDIEDTVPKHRRDYQTLYIVEDDAMVRSDHKQ
uniref:Uncharacterized protein n=1 Tax=Romanomermis culicivorax TaxID=13658 RepID=A0A915HNZ1_ROMCU